MITTTLPNGLETINTYDAASRLTRLAHVHDDEAVGQYDYELDPIGNRTALTETLVVSGSTSTVATPAPDPHSPWDDTAMPADPAVGDTDPLELGVRFESDVDGYITGLRFYKSTTNTGTHVGHLWTIGGKLLASVTFTNETASGWQTATFAYPVAIVSNTLYVASYYAPAGHFAVTREKTTARHIPSGSVCGDDQWISMAAH